jgi:hypothetical protein
MGRGFLPTGQTAIKDARNAKNDENIDHNNHVCHSNHNVYMPTNTRGGNNNETRL